MRCDFGFWGVTWPPFGTHERGRLGAADDARLVGLRDARTLRTRGRLGAPIALRRVGARGRLHDGLHAGEAGRADAGAAALAAGQFEQLVFVHARATASAFTLPALGRPPPPSHPPNIEIATRVDGAAIDFRTDQPFRERILGFDAH